MAQSTRQNSSHTQRRINTRNQRKSNSKYWLVGSVLAVVLVSIYLFSRNEHKERVGTRHATATTPSKDDSSSSGAIGKRTIRMHKGSGGVYYIPMRINGQELEFLFDTGASSILISKLEAELLEKQGRITSEDIEGVTEAQLADGRQVSVRCLNLREVELAGVKLYNIPAYIAENTDASLLLGQTAMSRFGSFKVDYKNETITFE